MPGHGITAGSYYKLAVMSITTAGSVQTGIDGAFVMTCSVVVISREVELWFGFLVPPPFSLV
jgi:hypothetical protein